MQSGMQGREDAARVECRLTRRPSEASERQAGTLPLLALWNAQGGAVLKLVLLRCIASRWNRRG